MVLWGHKLHTHTHSYIHFGLHRAFSALGFAVDWLDSTDHIDGRDFRNTLFITEGQVVENIPLQEDSFYVLHNCDTELHSDIYDLGHWLNIQVYSDVCRSKSLESLGDHTFFDKASRTLYMPWATDLLPHEIDRLDDTHPILDVEPEACFVGTIGDGVFGNRSELLPFVDACADRGIGFAHYQNLDLDACLLAIRKALLAPAIQGRWQIENSYIPCRIFKNISYGQIGITNSPAVRDLFGGSIVYNEDCSRLPSEAFDYIENDNADEIAEVQQWVRNHHTYVNRIEVLLGLVGNIAS